MMRDKYLACLKTAPTEGIPVSELPPELKTVDSLTFAYSDGLVEFGRKKHTVDSNGRVTSIVPRLKYDPLDHVSRIQNGIMDDPSRWRVRLTSRAWAGNLRAAGFLHDESNTPRKQRGGKHNPDTKRKAFQAATRETVQTFFANECNGMWDGTIDGFIEKFNNYAERLYAIAKLTDPSAKLFQLSRTTFFRIRNDPKASKLRRAFKTTGNPPKLPKGETNPLEAYTMPDDDQACFTK